MKRREFLFVAVTLISVVGSVNAADLNPSGDWKWAITNPANNQSRDFTAKLKIDGDKLAGTVKLPGGKEIDVEKGTYKDGKVSFSISRERKNGQGKLVTNFSGKLEENTITGTFENENEGGKGGQGREWIAKREKSS